MNTPHLPTLAALALALGLAATPGTSRADNCEAIQAGIDAKLRAGGLSGHGLSNVENGAARGGRVVGTCASGTRQIVMTPGVRSGQGVAASAAGVAPAPRPRPADKILTECKDGRVVVGPDCRLSPPAPPTPPAPAAPAAPAAAPAERASAP